MPVSRLMAILRVDMPSRGSAWPGPGRRRHTPAVCCCAGDAADERITVDARDGDPPAWRRSSHCSDSSCVEVAWSGEEVLVRDSKDPDGPMLAFSRRQWAEFLEGVRSGAFQDR
jgi:Domain of unknown function (DUF397)